MATKTIFITGASSGIGLQTALFFFEKGWNVVATMRNPSKRKTPLHDKKGITLLHLDVTDQKSIEDAIKQTLALNEKIDVLVNNAGYGLKGVFEELPKESIERQFQTNVYGVMNVTREILPVFRRQKQGILINIASMGGRVGFPLFSAYNASKWAVEGFSEALYFEVKPFGIKVKIIEPGVIETEFYGRSMESAKQTLPEYSEYSKRVDDGWRARKGTAPVEVAKAIYRAATDHSDKVRYQVGDDAKQLTVLKRVLPESAFLSILESNIVNAKPKEVKKP